MTRCTNGQTVLEMRRGVEDSVNGRTDSISLDDTILLELMPHVGRAELYIGSFYLVRSEPWRSFRSFSLHCG